MPDLPILPLQQHPHFARALRRLGRDVSWVEVAEAHPVLTVRVLGQTMASRGPVWHDAPCPKALAAAQIRLLNTDTSDDAGCHLAGYRKLATAACVAELDLRGTAAQRIAGTHGKWRNRWRRAQAAPVTIKQTRFDPVDHQWLLQADRAQQRQKRFRALPHALIGAFSAQDSDLAQLYIASIGQEPVAAMLFLCHRPVVTYQIGWISDAGRRWGLHHRMLLAAATDFAERGHARLDLGLVDTENAAGLARFKIGSGADVRVLGGSWLRVARARAGC